MTRFFPPWIRSILHAYYDLLVFFSAERRSFPFTKLCNCVILFHDKPRKQCECEIKTEIQMGWSEKDLKIVFFAYMFKVNDWSDLSKRTVCHLLHISTCVVAAAVATAAATNIHIRINMRADIQTMCMRSLVFVYSFVRLVLSAFSLVFAESQWRKHKYHVSYICNTNVIHRAFNCTSRPLCLWVRCARQLNLNFKRWRILTDWFSLLHWPSA